MDLFVPTEASYLLFCMVDGIMQIQQTWYIGHQEVTTIYFRFLLISIIKQESQAVETNFIQV